MKINDKRSVSQVTFGSLEVGDVFVDEGEFYIKINQLDGGTRNIAINSICLETGLEAGFVDFRMVEKVNAELVIS